MLDLNRHAHQIVRLIQIDVLFPDHAQNFSDLVQSECTSCGLPAVTVTSRGRLLIVLYTNKVDISEVWVLHTNIQV